MADYSHSTATSDTAVDRSVQSSSQPESSFTRRMSKGPDSAGIAPTSALLQELLRERKADDRAKAGRQPTNRRTKRESGMRDSMAPEDSGCKKVPVPREMGARESEEYMSSLHKQNFDLKLEIFHRRKRMAILEEQLQQMEVLRGDNAELQEVNEQLLQELEKRDRAVEEAVGIICQLEEQIRTLKGSTSDGDPSPSDVEDDDETDISNPEMGSALPEEGLGTPARVRSPQCRNLSFLASRSGTTSALRSLYLASETDGHGLRTARRSSNRGSTVAGDSVTYDSADEAPDVSDSPRLSVLSESSFLSVLGGRREPAQGSQQMDGPDETQLELDGRHALDGSRADDLEERAVSLVMDSWTTQHPPPEQHDRDLSPRRRTREKQLNSIADVLQQRRNPYGQANQERLIAAYDARHSTRPTDASHFGANVLQGPIYGRATLPPTPDTLSTVDQEGGNGSLSNLTIRGDSPPDTADSSITPASMRRPRSISDVGLRTRRGFPDDLSTTTTDSALARVGNGPVSPEQRMVNHYKAIAAVKIPPVDIRRGRMDAQEAQSSVPHIQPSQHTDQDRALIGLEIPRPAVRPRGTSSTAVRPMSARGLSYQEQWTQAALKSAHESPKKPKGSAGGTTEKQKAPIAGMEAGTVTTTIDASPKPSRPSPPRHSSFSFTTSLKKAGITSKLFGLGSTSSKSSTATTTTAPDVVNDAIGRSLSSINASVSVEATSTSEHDDEYSYVDLSSSQLLERGGRSGGVEDLKARHRKSLIPRTAETGHTSSSSEMVNQHRPSSSHHKRQPIPSSHRHTERPRSGHRNTRPGPPMMSQSFSVAQHRLHQPSSSAAAAPPPAITSRRGDVGGPSGHGPERRMSITSSSKDPNRNREKDKDKDKDRDRDRDRGRDKEKAKDQDGIREAKVNKKRWSLQRSMSALP
ncbi:MAG: hypothetical protein M1823_004005 [Watsoniomyces obsoletus]|nr:MAG: hypothetical protein M1823_004005 [Watsoniomyces obsoletus]